MLIPTNPTVWQRFKGCFQLLKGGDSQATISDVISLVLDGTHPAFQDTLRHVETISVTATGVYSTLVPAGEVWLVHFLTAELSTGPWTFTEMHVRNAAADLVVISAFGASGGRVAFEPNTPIPLRAGEGLSVYVNSYTGTGNLIFRAWVQRFFVNR